MLFIDPTLGGIRQSFDPGKGITATPEVHGLDVYLLSNLGFVYSLEMNVARNSG